MKIKLSEIILKQKKKLLMFRLKKNALVCLCLSGKFACLGFGFVVDKKKCMSSWDCTVQFCFYINLS